MRLRIIVLFVFFLFAYARWIEPLWIEVTHYQIKAPVRTPLKVAQLSDLHVYDLGLRERHLLKLLEQEKPDAILISGDSISANANYSALGLFLKQLKAPKGVWLVRGNWEHWTPSQGELRTYTEAGVRFLNNANRELAEGVWIVGLDDYLAGTPDVAAGLRGVPKEAFKLGLFHSPEYFSTLTDENPSLDQLDLVLAGHTHGGQVRLPFLPPLWLPAGSGKFIEGWYTGRDKNHRMYVSRGIGNSILEFRFFCRPELPIFTLSNSP